MIFQVNCFAFVLLLFMTFMFFPLQISNTKGELYSLSVRSPYFKWILDLSSFDNVFTVTPGNNGRLYITLPVKSMILAVDVSSGNVLWQGSIGPLSTTNFEPVIDSHGMHVLH